MTQRTRFINDQLANHLGKIPSKLQSIGVDYLGRYASNIETDLRSCGKNKLADRLLDELAAIGPGEPVKCAHEGCRRKVSYGLRNPETGKVYCDDHADF